MDMSETSAEYVNGELVITTSWPENDAWRDSVERMPAFGPFHTIEQMKRANEQAGLHFFDRDTMRFFRSRVAPGIYSGRVFITSEQFDASSPRLYTVRALRNDGSTTELSGFQQFESLRAARSYVAHALKTVISV
jgi:hypothetical protein